MKVTCTCCKGSKIQHLTIESYEKTGVETSKMDIPCVWCHGTGLMTTDEAKMHLSIVDLAKARQE